MKPRDDKTYSEDKRAIVIYRKQHIDSPAPEQYRQERSIPADPNMVALYDTTHQGVSLTWHRL
jgi:hypothetical protein